MREPTRSATLAARIPRSVTVAWWLLSRAIVPGLVIIVTALVLWLSGRQVLPRPRRYRRDVHAAGRCLLAALVLAAAVVGVAPVATAVGTVIVGAAVAGAVLRRRAYLARRAESDRSPIRVRAYVREPAGSIPADQPAAAGTWVYADRVRP